MKRHLRIIKIYFRDGISTLAAYRFNLILSGMANLLWVLGQVYYLNFIFEKVNTFDGWSKTDVILLFGLMQCFVYLMFIFTWESFANFYTKITSGEFDAMLLKPLNSKFMLTFQTISVTQIITGVLTVGPLIGIGLSGIQGITFLGLISAFLLFVIAISMMYFISLLLVSITFFIGDSSSLFELVIGTGAEGVKLPQTIFPTIVQALFTFLIPVAFIAYYPTLILKNIENPLPLILFALLLATIFYFLQKIFWNLGLKRYSGIA